MKKVHICFFANARKKTAMDYLTYSRRLAYLKEKIEKGRLSSPNDLTDKWSCSEKTIRNMINRLREEGFQIEYCMKSKRYVMRN